MYHAHNCHQKWRRVQNVTPSFDTLAFGEYHFFLFLSLFVYFWTVTLIMFCILGRSDWQVTGFPGVEWTAKAKESLLVISASEIHKKSSSLCWSASCQVEYPQDSLSHWDSPQVSVCWTPIKHTWEEPNVPCATCVHKKGRCGTGVHKLYYISYNTEITCQSLYSKTKTVNYIRKSMIIHWNQYSWMQCHMCAGVWWWHHIVRNLGSFPSTFSFSGESKREQAAVRCLQRDGMRHWISAWESVPASSSWAAETPPEGHDIRCSLSSHQAFHMSQPSLTSPPGWRKKRKRMLYYFCSCFTSPWVGSMFLFAHLVCTRCAVKTSCVALIWLIL